MNFLDKITGMIISGFLGDALGAPHEFLKSLPLSQYTGILQYEVILPRSYGHSDLHFPVGIFTDDSQMELYMIKSILEKGRHLKDDVIMKYIEFANQTSFLGRNTRALLKGIKTLRGYYGRTHKLNPSTESNGALMRAAPLAIFSDYRIWLQDTGITNISQANYISTVIYVHALRYAIEQKSKDKILHMAEHLANQYQNKDIILAISQAKQGIKRNVNEKNIPTEKGRMRSNKGWVVHGIYSAFWALYNFNSVRDGINAVVLLGGDTDTNAKIAGNLLGAFYGYKHIIEDETNLYNVNIFFNANKEYLTNFSTSVQKLASMYQQS